MGKSIQRVIGRNKQFCYSCMENHEIEFLETVETMTYKGKRVTSKVFTEYCPITDVEAETEFMMILNRHLLKEAYTKLEDGER